MQDSKRRRFAAHLVATFALAALAGTSAGNARAAVEIIPSVGISKSTDTNAGDASAFGGLALRAGLLPLLKVEGGIAYRQDTFEAAGLKVRQWPVTASLWFTPLPTVYAGGGVGWYRTTFDFPSTVPIEDTTSLKMGAHVGGGVTLPIATRLGLDFNGRYVFMQKGDEDLQVPTTFDPDFWNVSLGLAIQI